MSFNRKELKVISSAKKKQNPFSKDILYTPRGQYDFPYQPTRVPGSNMTMAGVPYPMVGIGSTGQQQIMYPGGEYSFPGSTYVDELPIFQTKGEVQPATEPNTDQAATDYFFDTIVQRRIDYLNSPQALEIMKKAVKESYPHYDDSIVGIEAKKWLRTKLDEIQNNLPAPHFVDGWETTEFDGTDTMLGLHHPDKGMFLKRQGPMFEHTMLPTVMAHELTHHEDYMGLNVTKAEHERMMKNILSEEEYINRLTKNDGTLTVDPETYATHKNYYDYLTGADKRHNVSKSGEIHGRLGAIKEGLQEAGIDIGNKKITKEDIDKWRKTNTRKDALSQWNELKELYGNEEEIINLLNTVVYQEPAMQDGLVRAKYGGSKLKKYQGTEGASEFQWDRGQYDQYSYQLLNQIRQKYQHLDPETQKWKDEYMFGDDKKAISFGGKKPIKRYDDYSNSRVVGVDTNPDTGEYTSWKVAGHDFKPDLTNIEETGIGSGGDRVIMTYRDHPQYGMMPVYVGTGPKSQKFLYDKKGFGDYASFKSLSKAGADQLVPGYTLPEDMKRQEGYHTYRQSLIDQASPTAAIEKFGGQYMDLELTDEQIKQYKEGGFVVEELPEYQTAGEIKPVNYYTTDELNEYKKSYTGEEPFEDRLLRESEEMGYFNVRDEQGNISSYDPRQIHDMIMKKGWKSKQIAELTGADKESITKMFQPSFDYHKAEYDMRGKRYLDELIQKGYTKDEAFDELINKRNFGDKEGLERVFGQSFDDIKSYRDQLKEQSKTQFEQARMRDLKAAYDKRDNYTQYSDQQLQNMLSQEKGPTAKGAEIQAQIDLRNYMVEQQRNQVDETKYFPKIYQDNTDLSADPRQQAIRRQADENIKWMDYERAGLLKNYSPEQIERLKTTYHNSQQAYNDIGIDIENYIDPNTGDYDYAALAHAMSSPDIQSKLYKNFQTKEQERYDAAPWYERWYSNAHAFLDDPINVGANLMSGEGPLLGQVALRNDDYQLNNLANRYGIDASAIKNSWDNGILDDLVDIVNPIHWGSAAGADILAGNRSIGEGDYWDAAKDYGSAALNMFLAGTGSKVAAGKPLLQSIYRTADDFYNVGKGTFNTINKTMAWNPTKIGAGKWAKPISLNTAAATTSALHLPQAWENFDYTDLSTYPELALTALGTTPIFGGAANVVRSTPQLRYAPQGVYNVARGRANVGDLFRNMPIVRQTSGTGLQSYADDFAAQLAQDAGSLRTGIGVTEDFLSGTRGRWYNTLDNPDLLKYYTQGDNFVSVIPGTAASNAAYRLPNLSSSVPGRFSRYFTGTAKPMAERIASGTTLAKSRSLPNRAWLNTDEGAAFISKNKITADETKVLDEIMSMPENYQNTELFKGSSDRVKNLLKEMPGNVDEFLAPTYTSPLAFEEMTLQQMMNLNKTPSLFSSYGQGFRNMEHGLTSTPSYIGRNVIRPIYTGERAHSLETGMFGQPELESNYRDGGSKLKKFQEEGEFTGTSDEAWENYVQANEAYKAKLAEIEKQKNLNQIVQANIAKAAGRIDQNTEYLERLLEADLYKYYDHDQGKYVAKEGADQFTLDAINYNNWKYASSPREMDEIAKGFSSKIKQAIPDYNLAKVSRRSMDQYGKYDNSDDLYCTTMGCYAIREGERMSGIKPTMPWVSGNPSLIKKVEAGTLPLQKIALGDAGPGDIVSLHDIAPADYRGDEYNPSYRGHHTGVISDIEKVKDLSGWQSDLAKKVDASKSAYNLNLFQAGDGRPEYYDIQDYSLLDYDPSFKRQVARTGYEQNIPSGYAMEYVGALPQMQTDLSDLEAKKRYWDNLSMQLTAEQLKPRPVELLPSDARVRQPFTPQTQAKALEALEAFQNRGYKDGGDYVELELDEDQIKAYQDGGFTVEEVPETPEVNLHLPKMGYQPRNVNPFMFADTFPIGQDMNALLVGAGVNAMFDTPLKGLRAGVDLTATNMTGFQDGKIIFNEPRINLPSIKLHYTLPNKKR